MFNILVADDDQEVRTIVELSLKHSFPEVCIFHASDGKEVFRLLERERIDLVILDLLMPFSNSIEVVRKCKSNNIKVVIYTGVHDIEICKSFIRIGADDYILKPFSISDVCDVVARIMEVEDKNRETLEILRDKLKKISSGLSCNIEEEEK